MATLVWDEVSERRYESGVSKGVLYKEDGSGVAWNGLTSIEESTSNDVEPTYFDGAKINDIITIGDFAATLRAFTYPDEFLEFEGIIEDKDGYYITQQMPRRFGLSYRTDIYGDDGIIGYKIHLLYNLTAVPSNKVYKTLSLDTEPMEFEWSLTSVPESLDFYKETSHVIFDSRKVSPDLLNDIEAIIYGDDENEAMLPSLKSLTSFVRKWARFIITDLGNGFWSARTSLPGVITMLDEDTFQIDTDTATYLDADTYTISSSDREDEDL